MSTDNKKNTGGKSCGECSCLTTCSNVVQHFLERVFGNLGSIVGNHPWKTIVISVFVTLCFGAGFTNWTTESRTNKLWIPQGTEAEAQSEWVSETFGSETRRQQILMRPNDNGNVLTADYVRQYWLAHFLMVNTSAPAEKGYADEFPGLYSWDGYQGTNSICLRLGPGCDMDTILDLVGYDVEDVDMLTDASLLELLNNENITGGADSLRSIIGGLELDASGAIVGGKVLSGTYNVEANGIDGDGQFVDPSREAWELAVANKILAYQFTDTHVVPYFAQSFNEEFSGAIASDGMAYALGCTLLIIYTSMALGKRDYVHSMVGLAFCAILTVGLTVMGSYGLAGALGIIYTPLGGSLPFLILGLGVDDAFIIAGEFQQQIKDSLMAGEKEVRTADVMHRTMKHAGVSILITSLTDFLAFSIGATTVLPALKAFCLFAAFGVFFVFMLNVTFFAACVVLDHDRAMSNRMDLYCCFKLKTTHYMFPELVAGTAPSSSAEDKPAARCCFGCHKIPAELSRVMFRKIGEAMMNVWVKIFILAGALGLLGFSIYGATQLKQDFKIQWFLPDTSYLQYYYSWNDEYFQTAPPLFIYTKDIDHLSHKQELLQCNYLLRNASYLDGTDEPYDWHLAFWRHVDAANINVTADNYYAQLQLFVSTSGAMYQGAVAWNDENDASQGLAGTQMIGQYKQSAVVDASAQVDSMFATRDDMAEIVGEDEHDLFAFTFSMLFWEQYAVIEVEFYRNLLLAVIVVFIIALVLIPKITAALLVLSAVVCTIVDVLGFMWLWGLTIDAVTVCYTVIAIGLAVDYSAHVGEAFMLSKAETKEARVIDALYRVGASVFNGAFSTFLAVVAMANSQTYIFRVFFRQFFLVTLLGSVHGLIVLPVLLSWFGPDGTDAKSERKKPVEDAALNNEERRELSKTDPEQRPSRQTDSQSAEPEPDRAHNLELQNIA